MTCIIQDADARYSIWAEPPDNHGHVYYTVQVGDMVYPDVDNLAEALAMCGLTRADLGV